MQRRNTFTSSRMSPVRSAAQLSAARPAAALEQPPAQEEQPVAEAQEQPRQTTSSIPLVLSMPPALPNQNGGDSVSSRIPAVRSSPSPSAPNTPRSLQKAPVLQLDLSQMQSAPPTNASFAVSDRSEAVSTKSSAAPAPPIPDMARRMSLASLKSPLGASSSPNNSPYQQSLSARSQNQQPASRQSPPQQQISPQQPSDGYRDATSDEAHKKTRDLFKRVVKTALNEARHSSQSPPNATSTSPQQQQQQSSSTPRQPEPAPPVPSRNVKGIFQQAVKSVIKETSATRQLSQGSNGAGSPQVQQQAPPTVQTSSPLISQAAPPVPNRNVKGIFQQAVKSLIKETSVSRQLSQGSSAGSPQVKQQPQQLAAPPIPTLYQKTFTPSPSRDEFAAAAAARESSQHRLSTPRAPAPMGLFTYEPPPMLADSYYSVERVALEGLISVDPSYTGHVRARSRPSTLSGSLQFEDRWKTPVRQRGQGYGSPVGEIAQPSQLHIRTPPAGSYEAYLSRGGTLGSPRLY